MEFSNVYEDSQRAEAYAKLEFPGTYYLAYRDLPVIISEHAKGKKAKMTDKNAKIVFRLRRFFQIRYIFCLVILLLGLSISCAGTGELVKTDLGQEVSLRIGQTAQIENEQLSIRFNGISGDSRCPRGVQCFWAGEVKCDVTVTYQGASSNITLTQPGIREPYPETYKGYLFIISVQPYPEAGKQISTAEYRLKMTVEKLPPGLDSYSPSS